MGWDGFGSLYAGSRVWLKLRASDIPHVMLIRGIESSVWLSTINATPPPKHTQPIVQSAVSACWRDLARPQLFSLPPPPVLHPIVVFSLDRGDSTWRHCELTQEQGARLLRHRRLLFGGRSSITPRYSGTQWMIQQWVPGSHSCITKRSKSPYKVLSLVKFTFARPAEEESSLWPEFQYFYQWKVTLSNGVCTVGRDPSLTYWRGNERRSFTLGSI